VLQGGAGTHGLFAVGAIDVAGLAVMAGAFLLAARAVRRTLGAWRLGAATG
jgi:hypothetical protein